MWPESGPSWPFGKTAFGPELAVLKNFAEWPLNMEWPLNI